MDVKVILPVDFLEEFENWIQIYSFIITFLIIKIWRSFNFLNTLHFFVLYSFTNFFFVNEVLRWIFPLFWYFSLSSRLTYFKLSRDWGRRFCMWGFTLGLYAKVHWQMSQGMLVLIYRENTICWLFNFSIHIYKTVWNKD